MSFEFVHMMSGKHGTTRETVVSEAHAVRLLEGHTRNTSEAIESLKGNPWAQLVCANGTVYARPAKGG